MAKPFNHPKPNLSDLASRKLALPMSRDALEAELYVWMGDIVKRTGQQSTGYLDAQNILMATAKDSIDVLMQAPTSMAIGDSGGKRTVHAQFQWARFADGKWYVSAVAFGVDASATELRLAQQRATKERLLDKAEAENAKHLHLRKIVFPAESHHDTWPDDVKVGDGYVSGAVNFARTHAQKDAAMLENPVKPKDMAQDLVGLAVGQVKGPRSPKNLEEEFDKQKGVFDSFGPGGYRSEFWKEPEPKFWSLTATERAKQLGEWYEHIEYGGDAKELWDLWHEKEKSTGDKVMLTGMALASKIPGAGPFVKTIAGEFFNIAIASDAARITRIRSRFYVWFVAGYIGELTMYDTGSPKLDVSHGKAGELWYRWDTKYYNLGRSLVAPSLRFYPQASLMHYAAEHYTAGGWGGLAFRPHNWKTIDDYIANWSPELLGHALATQLHTLHNLTD